MSGGQKQPPITSEVEQILQKLNYEAGTEGESEERHLSRLTADIRHYLQQTPAGKWPATPDLALHVASQAASLKCYLGWALKQRNFKKAIAAIFLLESSRQAGVFDTSLFDDIMQCLEQEGPDDVIPPQLLISWAKILQIKGDLHGAIRRLNKAKFLLEEYKSTFLCPCEVERIRGICTQLSGLTLNKMCCWKSALQPLMESINIFRGCTSEGKKPESILTSIEIAAKCLCNIPHGDYLELKEQLGFQHNDRFYQAYTMCKDAAAMASSSKLLFIRAQNQAAESLLKYSAQLGDPQESYKYLEMVIASAQKALKAYSSVLDLAAREQFFEFIHSFFIIFMALSFSNSPQDRAFADSLGEQARFLYAEYCRQLCEKGFQLNQIDLKGCLVLERVIGGLVELFDLTLDLENTTDSTAPCKSKQSNYIGENPTKAKHEQGTTKTPENSVYQSFRDLKVNSEKRSLAVMNSQGEIHRQICTNPSAGKKIPQDCAKRSHSQPPNLKEVGLPVNPEDYAIPVYDVPLNIFQDLIGCKFTNVSAQDGGLEYAHGENNELEEGNKEVVNHTGDDPVLGITQDSGYGSAMILVDTFLTTRLPESYMSNGGSDVDSGIGSSISSADLSDSSCPSSDNSAKVCQSAFSSSRSVDTDTVKKARMLKFNPVTGIWSSQITLIYVGQPLPLDSKHKGNCRDALEVQFLHQDEVLGRYVGKRYRRQRPPSQYLQDITCQKTARFLVTLFNYALKDLRYDIQVVYVPVAHMQLLSRDGREVEDWLNVEPYLEGDFIKLTNNLKYCNSQGKTLATALTHFTYSVSEGKLMLVDLQGWLPREGRGVVYLTDPQFHTDSLNSLSSCDMGQKGMQAFWESVHPQCNAICQALGLKRPEPDCTQ